jgi:Transposase DDE domain group 1
LASLRRHWPQTHILVRGDSHCATPEVIEVLAHRRQTDCVCGGAGQAVWLRQAAPVRQEARGLDQPRLALAPGPGTRPPASTRLSEAFCYGAASWAQPWRVLVTAAGMAAGDKPRLVVTS